MNLYDVVHRKDRCLNVLEGAVEAVRRPRPQDDYVVRLSPGARLRLQAASEFTLLRSFPRDLGWRVSATERLPLIAVRDEARGRTAVLSEASGARPSDTPGFAAPLLTWPAWIGTAETFDLELCNEDRHSAVDISVAPVFDTRAALRPLLKGEGVEVGPGLNPIVRPGFGVRVRYVEAMPIEDWVKNYAKQHTVTAKDRALFAHYVIGDAQKLDPIEDGSLDFIFSNHVFEHLMNPLGVLERWSAKLKPGGAIVGVTPDLRYCFDLRQPPSTREDWLAEYEDETWSLTDQKYDKWIRYTAPYNKRDDLKARGYSIHAHYYMPETFLTLIDLARERSLVGRAFLNTSPANKDFGFALWT